MATDARSVIECCIATSCFVLGIASASAAAAAALFHSRKEIRLGIEKSAHGEGFRLRELAAAQQLGQA